MKLQTKFVACLVLFLLSTPSFSGTVTQSKNNKVLIDFKGETVNVGDQFFILNTEKKKIALVLITISKNNKAIADVTKGKALIGQTTLLYKQNKSENKSATIADPILKPDSVILRYNLLQVGVHFKVLMNTIAAEEKDNSSVPQLETVSMLGTNFGVAATADYPLFDFLRAQGQISYEMLDVAGTAQFNSCDGRLSTNCNVKINYLGFQGLGRYDFIKSKYNLWLGVGGALKIPISKKSTAIDTAKMENSNSITVATGMDYHLNNKSYLPVSLEYQHSLNVSSEVPTISQIALMVGYGMKF